MAAIACLVSRILFCNAQVVNIESERIQSDTSGWFGNIGGNLSFSSNVKTVFVFDASAQVEYKKNKDLLLMLGSYGFVSGDEEAFFNNAFVHFRYNRKIGKVLRWEVFTQVQFNKISKIDFRYLLGTGPRFKLLDTNPLRVYAATLAMYEYEEDDTTENPYHNDIRSSSYVTFTLVPKKEVISIVSTTYYQPLYNDLNDFRILTQESLVFNVSKKFIIEPKFSYLYDNRPVSGVPKVNYTFSTTFKYTFAPK